MISPTPAAKVVAVLMMQVLFCRAVMLSSTGSAWRMEKLFSRSSDTNSVCTDLKNRGTHFTVDVEVGTPGQTFSIVADTGSNSLIVPSCICRQRMYCKPEERCFTGTNKSSTFLVEQDPKAVQIHFGSGTIEAVKAKDVVTIGTNARMSVTMNDGILLMVGRMLRIGGNFEGILGLGLPNASAVMAEEAAAAKKEALKHGSQDDMMKHIIEQVMGGAGGADIEQIMGGAGGADMGDIVQIIGSGGGVDAQQIFSPEDSQPVTEIKMDIQPMSSFLGPSGVSQRESPQNPIRHIPSIGSQAPSESSSQKVLESRADHKVVESRADHKVQSEDEDEDEDHPSPTGLLEQAGVAGFSMCFNDGADGVLKIGKPEASDAALGNIGKVHWGLDLQGLSVGDQTVPMAFCTKENMTEGQDTACGAIPDSGTTVIMGPSDQLSMMFEGICDNWERCRQNYTALVKAAENAKAAATAAYGIDPFDIQTASKADVMSLLLLDCGSWLTEKDGLDELPPIHFHLGGSNGGKKAVKLPGWAYVLESTSVDTNETYKHLSGLLQEGTLQNASKPEKVCSPAFGVMDYKTKSNGPVWILGTPLFYEYHVGYNLESSPPSISFIATKDTPCTSCEGKASLLSQQARQSSSQPARRRPRWISGPYRLPSIDVDQPL